MNLAEQVRVYGAAYTACSSRADCMSLESRMQKGVLNLRQACEIAFQQLENDVAENSEEKTLLMANYTAMENDSYRSLLVIPSWYGPIWTSVFVNVIGPIMIGVCIFIIAAYFSKRFGLTYHARPYLWIVAGLTSLVFTRLIITGVLNLIGTGPQFHRSWLAVALVSDLVLVGASGLVWIFLYLWSDAYHELHREARGLRNLLGPKLIFIAGAVWVAFLVALTIAQRVLFYSPGSKYEGRFAFVALPLACAHIAVGAIGLALYSYFLLQLFRPARSSTEEATFRYRRIREMLVVSCLMIVFGLISTIILIVVALKRYSLTLSGKLDLLINGAVGFAEVTWSIMMLLMLLPLFFGRALSDLRNASITSSKEHRVPLLENHSAPIPQMYDV